MGREIVSKGGLQNLKNAVPDALRWKNVSDIEIVLRKENIYRILYEFQWSVLHEEILICWNQVSLVCLLVFEIWKKFCKPLSLAVEKNFWLKWKWGIAIGSIGNWALFWEDIFCPVSSLQFLW